MRQKFFLFLILAGLFLSAPLLAQENFHLFFLEKQEGNLRLFLEKDTQNSYRPKNEIFLYEVLYAGLPVGECLIKYHFDGRKFLAHFSSNTMIMPRKAIIEIDPKTMLPQKIEVFEKAVAAEKTIIYNQKNFSVAVESKTTRIQNKNFPVIEPTTMACLFRTYNLTRGRADFFFGLEQNIFSFNLSRPRLVKTPSGEIYQYQSRPPKITIYFDSTRKIPVGVVYELFVGKLELKLKKYVTSK